MTAALVLWTFVFYVPVQFAGRTVENLTEQDCRKLATDAARVFSPRHNPVAKVGECIPQRTVRTT